LKLASIPNEPYLYRVDIAPEVGVAQAMAAAGMEDDEFLRFNPGFTPGGAPPSRAYNLLLPRHEAKTLAATVPGTRLVAASKYTVRRGDTLGAIAKRHGISWKKLAEWNGMHHRSVLRSGQQLIVQPAS
jgi:membrane-bound lytic murein transglycosylase D